MNGRLSLLLRDHSRIRTEERNRGEVLALVEEYIYWYNHERIKRSLGWMGPVQYRQSRGMAV
ncbi:IS3 family transposase [Bifidobacterium adolescentis]|uniref:IS3 family transposase n=1 Tax=Bifidobacterium adolescentis TaxID=1680 RepID=UPI003BB656CE